MAPHLDRWEKTYGERGLRVIEVENGRATRDLPTLEQALAARGVAYPVLYDADAAVTERFGVPVFPTAFLVDRNGKVVWHGVPLRDVTAVERRIEQALGR
ncbi:MAG: TlpA family protein disulfide reductase [Planctomycetes bacterium]|nr:TlpA family protein disulfide reductase [Planctomycetota bacterium]